MGVTRGWGRTLAHMTECASGRTCGGKRLFFLRRVARLCHVCGLYDDKSSGGVTPVRVAEDWWSWEAGDPSPSHRDFRSLFPIASAWQGPRGNDPSQCDTTGNRYQALKVNVLLENYLSPDGWRARLHGRQGTDSSSSSVATCATEVGPSFLYIFVLPREQLSPEWKDGCYLITCVLEFHKVLSARVRVRLGSCMEDVGLETCF